MTIYLSRINLVLACLFVFYQHTSAQAIRYDIDTAFHDATGCKDMNCIYFHLKAKYPESSRRLANLADLACKDVVVNASGNITFRMIIDCDGKIAALRLYQTNPAYQKTEFSKELVERLYHFVKALKEWKKMVDNGQPVYYFTYLNFKIRAGHVAEVTP